MSRWRVRVGYVLGLLVVFLAAPTRFSVLMGLPLAFLGEILRVWASGHIEKFEGLATGGPYAHTRNPLYLGSFLLGLGLAIALGGWVALALIAYFVLFYPSVMREEAGYLRQRFPEEYAAWAAAVPSLLPRLTPAGPRATHFQWRRVQRNLEWRTVAAIILISSLLFMWSLGWRTTGSV